MTIIFLKKLRRMLNAVREIRRTTRRFALQNWTKGFSLKNSYRTNPLSEAVAMNLVFSLLGVEPH